MAHSACISHLTISNLLLLPPYDVALPRSPLAYALRQPRRVNLPWRTFLLFFVTASLSLYDSCAGMISVNYRISVAWTYLTTARGYKQFPWKEGLPYQALPHIYQYQPVAHNNDVCCYGPINATYHDNDSCIHQLLLYFILPFADILHARWITVAAATLHLPPVSAFYQPRGH